MNSRHGTDRFTALHDSGGDSEPGGFTRPGPVTPTLPAAATFPGLGGPPVRPARGPSPAGRSPWCPCPPASRPPR